MMKIARLEVYKLIRHPMTWGLLTFSLSLLTALFYRLCVDYLQLAQEALHQHDVSASLSLEIVKPLCSWSMVLLAILFPIFTTHAISQESRQKTFYLWANSPVKPLTLVTGKFLSLIGFLLILQFYLLLLVGVLRLETPLNWGFLATAMLAVGLVGASLISFGLFISSVIGHPLLAIGVTFLGNLFWMLLEWLNPFPGAWQNSVKEFSLLSHSYTLLSGYLHTPDIVFYVVFTAFWLFLTWRTVSLKMAHLL